jgi:hypothetical protein
LFVNYARLKRSKINQADRKVRLSCEVEAKISFVHGSGRVMRHRRMPVNAIDLAPCGRKEIAEEEEPAQVRRGDTNWNSLGFKYLAPDLERAPDAAPVRC